MAHRRVFECEFDPSEAPGGIGPASGVDALIPLVSWSGGPYRAAGTAVWILGAMMSLILTSAVLVIESTALFVDTTESTGSNFSVGSVELVDDDAAAALFSISDMTPGQSATDCIIVTYQGTIADPAAVRLYSGGYVDSGDLDTFMNLTIEEGSGGAFGDCTGFSPANTIESGGTLSDFDITHVDYSTGAGVWDPSTSPESTTYRITIELDAAVPSAEQGESLTAVTFNWEVRS